MQTRRFAICSRLRQPTRFLERIAGVPLLLVLIPLTVLFPTVLFPLHEIGDLRPLDLHFSYDHDQAYQYLAALGAEKREAYTVWALTSDLAFPVVYSTALSVALMLALRRMLPAAGRCLALFPFLIIIADWFENLSLVMVARALPRHMDNVVIFASFSTSLKWSLILISILLLLAAVIYRVTKGFRNTPIG